MKGLAHTKPHYPSIAQAYEKILVACQTKDFRPAAMYEYFSLAKINSIDPETTPFRRDPTPSVLLLANWTKDDPEKSLLARNLAQELSGLLVGAQSELTNVQSLGYANYGKGPSLYMRHPV